MYNHLQSHWFYYIIHPGHFIYGIYRNVQDFIHRGMFGYAKSDVWSIDFYISTILPPMLRQLKEYESGFPAHFITGSNRTERSDAKAQERWDRVLDEMIAGFEAAYKQDMGEYEDQAEWEKLEVVRKKGMGLFTKHYHSLWD